MTCNAVHDLLPLFDDPELTDSERTLMQAHLATCQQCAKQLAGIRSAQDQMRMLRDIQAPADGPERIIKATHSLPASPLRRTWRYIMQGYPLPAGGFLAGAVALVLMVILPALQGSEPAVPEAHPITMMSAPSDEASMPMLRTFAFQAGPQADVVFAVSSSDPAKVVESISLRLTQGGQSGQVEVAELPDGTMEVMFQALTPETLGVLLESLQKEPGVRVLSDDDVLPEPAETRFSMLLRVVPQ